jgi:mannose-6-phosphate isomerase-like protein (cupin superfamily)
MKSSTTKKPWGSFTRFTDNEESTVKILNVTAGEELSLQYHMKREEFWRVLKGNPRIVVGEEVFEAKEGDEFFIGQEVKHRIGAPQGDVEVLEISLGHFDENDIVRVEDKYNRVQ